MRLEIPLVVFSASAAFAAPQVKPDCTAANHPCNTFKSQKECSPEWSDLVNQCVASNCRQFFDDPHNVCKANKLAARQSTPNCGAVDHPCNTFGKQKQCAPEWTALVNQCVASGCVQFFTDPLDVCKSKTVTKRAAITDCAAADHPCNTVNKQQQCSIKWSSLMTRCVASNCIQFFDNPFNVCKTNKLVTRANDCAREDHPCKTFTESVSCSERWTDEVSACVDSGCVKFFDNPLNICKARQQSTVARRATADCTAADHPCNTFNSKQQCSAEWSALLTQCVNSNCRQFFDDPFNVCKAKTQ